MVIPTYDEKDNVRPMAEAVLNCGADGVEILFMDDNSPDGTGKILDEMASADEEVPIVFSERRTGYSKITFGIAVESFKMALRL